MLSVLDPRDTVMTNQFLDMLNSLENLKVFSVGGIYSLIHWVIVIVMAFILYRFIHNNRPLRRIYGGTNVSLRAHVLGACEVIIIINTIILLLTLTTYGSDTYEFRYLLFSVMAGFIILAAGIDEYTSEIKQSKKKLMYGSIWTIFATLWILANCGMYSYYQGNDYYESGIALANALDNVSEVINDETEATYWFFAGSGDICEIARVMRLTKEGVDIADGDNIYSVKGWGTKNDYDIPAKTTKHTYLIVSEDDAANINDIVDLGCEYVESVAGYRVYVKE